MFGEPDQFIGQQLQRPAGAARRRARTGGGDQQGFFPAGELAIGARTRLFVQRRIQTDFDEAALGPVHGRAANRDARGNRLVADAGVGGQQNLCPLELAGRALAAAHQRGQFTTLGFAQFDVVKYVHPGPPRDPRRQMNQQMNQLFAVCPRRLSPSPSSRASIWPSSMPTHACSVSLPPKPTCSATSGSPRQPSTQYTVPIASRATRTTST